MEKIMVRKRVLKGQARCVRSAWIDLSEGKGFRSTKRLLEEFGWKKLMEQLFHEEPDSDELQSSTLYQAYIDISAAAPESRAGCRENEDFVEMYKLSEEFALWLTGNIYLYHIIPRKEVYTKIVPWHYADGAMYLGDRWGEEDQQIVENIQRLSVIRFLQRYKGYIGY